METAVPNEGDPIRLWGGRYVHLLEKHLRRLHGHYQHGNRVLFFDQLVSAYLLAFFNPSVHTLRTLSDFSQVPAVQEQLTLRKLCRSTVSDANALMDPRLLEGLITELQARVPDLKHRDTELSRLLEQIRVVDGSFFAAAADIAFAFKDSGGSVKNTRSGKARKHAKVRVDFHLDGRMMPRLVQVCGKGESESLSLMKNIEPRKIYVLDRGYVAFELLSSILAGSADFVVRQKELVNFRLQEEQILDEHDRRQNILHDHLGELTGSPHSWRDLPGQQLREILIFDADNPEKPIRLLTSLLDVPAHLIAQLYRWRWQIELFFRWLKVHAHFRHLISHSRQGMTLGFHVAVIAVLLMYLHTGRPMSKYAYSLLSVCASGMAGIDEILPILEAREKESERDRQSLARRQAKKRAT